MKEERIYCSNHGKVLHSQIVKGLPLAEVVYPPNLELPKHSHRLGGFCLILKGRCTESYGKTSLKCEPLSVKFQPAGEAHSDIYGNKAVRCFIIELQSEWLRRMGASALVGSSPLVYRNSSLAWLMMRLRSEFHSGDDESQLVVEGLVLELIAETSRSRRRLNANTAPLWLQQAKEFLYDQFSQPLSLSLVAEFVGVHPIYLANSFRQYYHMSVGEYIRRCRVNFACRKITTSNDSLVDIALAAGFSNQSHFSRVFKQVTRMTPATYRDGCRLS